MTRKSGTTRFAKRTAAGIFLGLMMAATAPASLTPLYSNTGGAVSQVSVFQIQPLEVVTAVRNGSGDLEVGVWQDTGSSIVQVSSATAGAIKLVEITSVSTNQLVTVAANSKSNLELTLWQVDSSGKISQQYSTTYTLTVTRISVTGLALGVFATGTRDSSGNLDVKVWKAGASSFTLLAGTSAGAISEVSVASRFYTSYVGSQFVTVTRNSGGNLAVINWIVGSSTLTQGGQATLGAIKHQSSVAIGTLGSNTVYGTVVINGKGDLEFIEWSVLGSTVTELGSGTAGAGNGVAICQGFPNTITAMRNGSGNLSVEQWDVKTTPFTLAGRDNTTTAISAVAVTPDAFIGSMVTAVRNSAGSLELTVWQEK